VFDQRTVTNTNVRRRWTLRAEGDGVPCTEIAMPGMLLVDLNAGSVALDLASPHAQSDNGESDAAIVWNGEPAPTVTLIRRPRGGFSKRALDISLVLATSVIWMPMLAVLSLLVKCTSRGPVFYAHTRLGRNGSLLRCPKLRTMHVDADDRLASLLDGDPARHDEFIRTFKLRRDPRVTRIGRVLRASGLDELPQLWCVLRGTMSLVGPRPIVAKEADYFGPYLSIVHSIRPGLTGLWQTSGRNDIPYPQRVAYEVEYVLTRSFWTDLRIIGATARDLVLMRGRGS
jgi:lipopolysaccharide/colanic/teichoic acid biosynthesis glycosyltransferase